MESRILEIVVNEDVRYLVIVAGPAASPSVGVTMQDTAKVGVRYGARESGESGDAGRVEEEHRVWRSGCRVDDGLVALTNTFVVKFTPLNRLEVLHVGWL